MKKLVMFILFLASSAHGNPVEDIARSRQEMFHQRASLMEGGFFLLADWRKVIMKKKESSKAYQIELAPLTTIKKRNPFFTFVFGIKTKCAGAYGLKGRSNSLLDSKLFPPSTYSPETLKIADKIKNYFDDPHAKCKDPKTGFDIFAVGPGENQLNVVVLDEENVRRINEEIKN